MVSFPNLFIESSKSKYTPKPLFPIPRPASHASFADLEAISLGAKLPKDGYFLSR